MAKSVGRVTDKQLGQILIEKGLINQEQLNNALIVQKEKGGLLRQVIVKLGYIKEEDIAKIQSD